MTRDNFKRASDIECELSQLRPLQREIEKNELYNLYFGTTLCAHKGLQKAVRDYIYKRMNELNKEFNEL